MMGRPTEYSNRIGTSLRLERDLHNRAKAVAAERGIAVNLLIETAVAQYLDRLPPMEELLRTRD
jgi:predicted HicB family RNase H-like nuclease